MKPATFLLIALGTVLGCGSTPSTSTRERGGSNGLGTVVQGSELGANLLQSLRSRVASMTISERAGECPRIQFRGPTSLRDPTSPSVYVDGVLMLDTCILTQMSTMEIDYVHVYPSGHTSRPGVQYNPAGVILIYRVRQ